MSLGVQLQPESLPSQSDPLLLIGVHGGFSSVSAIQEAQGSECDLAQDGRGASLASALCPPSQQALLCAVATPPELETLLYIPSCRLNIVLIRKKESIYVFF